MGQPALELARQEEPSANATVPVLMLDDCEPTSFNAVFGEGACTINGTVTESAFGHELAATHTVASWRNHPVNLTVPVGTVLDVVNAGGRPHTFTRVAHFGGGRVPPLNLASGNPIPAPECLHTSPSTDIRHGGRLSLTLSREGTINWMCCIHPWMRTTAVIQ